MKEIVVISGKGGTGKTSIAASLFTRLPKPVLADCDVDAPDLHILFSPQDERHEEFIGTQKARPQSHSCSGCGACVEACRFGALVPGEPPTVLDSRCEGCGVCSHLCPSGAIELVDVAVGTISRGQTDWGPMVRAKLVPGEETSGKLVYAVREKARAQAEALGAQTLLIDGSPGIGCNVISSLTGANQVVLVTEPTRSAFHDLQRVHELVNRFGIPCVLVVNKWNLHPPIAEEMEEYAQRNSLPLLMRLPYDLGMVDAITHREVPSKALPDLFQQSGFESLVEALIEAN
ncbi:MAG: ATP-binding protein [Spirochaetales bacterium]|nr:ATP-binding protein [Spirochaetales bacterium]